MKVEFYGDVNVVADAQKLEECMTKTMKGFANQMFNDPLVAIVGLDAGTIESMNDSVAMINSYSEAMISQAKMLEGIYLQNQRIERKLDSICELNDKHK